MRPRQRPTRTRTSCTALPFTAHAEFNNTDRTINVFRTTDCTGRALTYPPTDFHSFANFDGRSFRVAG